MKWIRLVTWSCGKGAAASILFLSFHSTKGQEKTPHLARGCFQQHFRLGVEWGYISSFFTISVWRHSTISSLCSMPKTHDNTLFECECEMKIPTRQWTVHCTAVLLKCRSLDIWKRQTVWCVRVPITKCCLSHSWSWNFQTFKDN